MKKLGKKYNALENSVTAYICYCQCVPPCWDGKVLPNGGINRPDANVTSILSSGSMG